MAPQTSVFFPPAGDGDAQPAAAPPLLKVFCEGFDALQADLVELNRMVNQLKQGLGAPACR